MAAYHLENYVTNVFKHLVSMYADMITLAMDSHQGR